LFIYKHGGEECWYYTSEVKCTYTISGVLCIWSSDVCDTIRSCSDINEISKCDNYLLAQGKCFLNGEACENVEDIGYCDELITWSVCSNATTNTYPNLLSDGVNKYPCRWDNQNQICERKVSESEKENPMQNYSNIIVIVIIIVAVVIVLVIVIVIVIITLYKRKIKKNLKNSIIKDLEMESLRCSRISSTREKTQRRTGLLFIFYFSCWFCLVKGESSNNEYAVGDTVGQYEVEKIIGRGSPPFFFLCFIIVGRIIWSGVFVLSC
jgi:hypothetical protein